MDLAGRQLAHHHQCHWVCSNGTSGEEAEAVDSLAELGLRKPTWYEFFVLNLLLPMLVQLAMTLLLTLLAPLYTKLYSRKGNFYRFIQRFIGTSTRPRVDQPFVVMLCHTLQIFFSMVATTLYVRRQYNSVDYSRIYPVEYVLNVFFALQYCVLRLHAGLQPSSAWTSGAIVDVFTIIPVLLPVLLPVAVMPATDVTQVDWLSLKFLRIFRALQDFQLLLKTVDPEQEFATELLLTLLRTSAMVIAMGGVIFCLEVLGDFPNAQDAPIATGMGDISFLQMNYWIFTTISTVGYGDFSPTTAPSRYATIVFIVAGIIFFSQETSNLVSIITNYDKGRGPYRVRSTNTHVIVTGPGVAKFSSLMETFFLEALAPVDAFQTPDIVLLSETPFDQQMYHFVQNSLLPTAKQHVNMLLGSPMVHRDLKRAKLQQCLMAFVLPDLDAVDSSEEDNHNLLRALEMMRVCPWLKLRLMLVEPDSMQRAMTLGLARHACFSSGMLKCSLLAQSARVRGLTTLVAGLLQVTTDYEVAHVSYLQHHEWGAEYVGSLQQKLHGFALNDHFRGMPFSAVVAEVYERSKGLVLIVGAQVDGHLLLNFQGQLQTSPQVVVAITCSYGFCKQFANTSQDWYNHFVSRRLEASRGLSSMQRTVMASLEGTEQQNKFRRFNSCLDTPGEIVCTHLDTSTAKAVPGTPAVATPAALQATDLRPAKGPPIMLVVVGCQQSTWLQVAAVMQSLWQPYLPSLPPLIILSRDAPPKSLVNEYEPRGCSFLAGPLLRMDVLLAAGVQEVSAVLILRGEDKAADQSVVLADYEMVSICALIEQVIAASDAEEPPFAVYDFGSTHAVHLLEQATVEDMEATEGQLSGALVVAARPSRKERGPHPPRSDLSKLGLKLIRFRDTSTGVFMHLFFHGMGSHEMAFAEAMRIRLILHHRFISGQAFSPDFFGGMLGHMIHFPGTLEFVDALAMPGKRDQTSFPWQVQCPEQWVGRRFHDLLLAWLSQSEDSDLQGCGPAIVLGLYREYKAGNGSGPAVDMKKGYSVTLPKPDTLLRASDLITVLAPRQFGASFERRGLLGKGCHSDAPKDTQTI